MRKIEKGKIYRHFKGNLYYLVDIVYDCETKDINNPDKVVIYRALYGEHITWARSYQSFISEVDHEKYPDAKQKYRFEEYELEKNK